MTLKIDSLGALGFFLIGLVVGGFLFVILFINFDKFDKVEINFDEMCFSLPEGDLRNGVFNYCKYVDDDCWKDFMEWSGGKGLYWNANQ